MTSINRFIAQLAAALLLVAASNSQAALMIYTDESAWLAALNGTPHATMDFDNATLPATDIINVPSYNQNGIFINNLAHIIGPAFGGGQYDIGTGQSAQVINGATSTISAGGNPIFAGGLSYWTVQPSGQHAAGNGIFNVDGTEYSFATPAAGGNGAANFFGFISDTALNSFTARAPNLGTNNLRRWLQTDNVHLVTTPIPANNVSEPGGLALLALGMVGLLRRRKP